MSEETEKKQEFVVHKKQKDSAPATQTAATQSAEIIQTVYNIRNKAKTADTSMQKSKTAQTTAEEAEKYFL